MQNGKFFWYFFSSKSSKIPENDDFSFLFFVLQQTFIHRIIAYVTLFPLTLWLFIKRIKYASDTNIDFSYVYLSNMRWKIYPYRKLITCIFFSLKLSGFQHVQVRQQCIFFCWTSSNIQSKNQKFHPIIIMLHQNFHTGSGFSTLTI